MFCADYLLAFVSHFIVSKCYHQSFSAPSSDVGLLTFHCSTGLLSGVFASLALYPFDAVRMTTVPKGSSHFAWSSIPFNTAYLGIYFYKRDKNDLNSKFVWSVISTTTGAIVEFPFDSAKRNYARFQQPSTLLI